eukprot:Tbor_TRINITY_DN266_c0_g1::TRINITY_DN266_c0_g1_i1::g.12208::m.12208
MLKRSGDRVFPGDILYHEKSSDEDVALAVSAGTGCKAEPIQRSLSAPTCSKKKRERDDGIVIHATVQGTTQWEDNTVSVLPHSAKYINPHTCTPSIAGFAKGCGVDSTAAASVSIGSKVICRITRSSRHAAQGNIIAIDHGSGTFSWCHIRGHNGFKGSLRTEDIRPVVLKNDVDASLLATFPASSVTSSGAIVPPAYASFRPGDIVVTHVLSHSDTKQCQLSSMADDTGCISSSVEGELIHVRGRRDIMINRRTGKEVSRWCPKL